MRVDVVGAGLAGCEAAFQIAKRGVNVRMFEMKPQKKSPAHVSDGFAELVCSNSLRSDKLENAVGLLKEEMRRMGSLVLRAADATRVPAGGALAVDREAFSCYITHEIRSNPLIDIEEREVTSLSELGSCAIVATGPLTSEALAADIERLVQSTNLHFFDAAAPIVCAESIDFGKAFFASRWNKGEGDYLNCPMTKEQYDAFYEALITARCAPVHEFENQDVFEGCMPVEVMAARGRQTLAFGPMKPAGIYDPQTGKRPYAVVQLRKENDSGTLYNIVGFQTHLAFPEQRRVFRMIPGLEHAEFIRYGVMHRNTYLRSPGFLNRNFRVKGERALYFAGQLTGVEGYVESAASGLLAGVCAASSENNQPEPFLSSKTAIGALGEYVSGWASSDFQPMNINFGIMEPLAVHRKIKAEKYEALAARALAEIDAFVASERVKGI